MREALREADLAPPLVAYLRGEGWTVRSEVKDCDIAATRDGELLVVEMKTSMSLALLTQAANRQRITDTVYVAIPRPANKWKWWKDSRGVQHLLRRLELGLLLVSTDPAGVDVVFHPHPFTRKKRAKTRRAVLHEIESRTADYNRAGSNRTKLVTAYRENAIHVACCLRRKGSLAPAQLRALGTGEKTYSILRNNVYGWFERRDDGTWALTDVGGAALADYPALTARYSRKAAAVPKKKKGT